MGSTPSTYLSPDLLVHRLVSLISPAWIAILLRLYHELRGAFTRDSAMYEILEYDSTLDLLDTKGKTVIFKRRQKVKFLQNNIIAFQDHAWGEGDIFAGYKVSPGIVADRYQEGDRWNLLISLRETKSKGAIEDFYIERTVRDGFTKAEEWWQVEVWQKTHRLKLQAFFPKRRHCRRAVLHTRARNKTMVLGHEHFQVLPDGRQLLTWQTINPQRAEVYTIRWTW